MEWKPIKGFEGLYAISIDGVIKSLSRNVVKAQSTNNWGYKTVSLFKDGKHYHKFVHRLIAETFIPPFCGEQINHIDGNKSNNSVENLEWCVGSENMTHAFEKGLHSKVVPVKIVELDRTFPTISEAARFVDGNVSGIWRCLSGRNKTHRGYHFERVAEVANDTD